MRLTLLGCLFLCGIATVSNAAPTEPLPGQIVVQINPATDLIALLPGWGKIVTTPQDFAKPGCTMTHVVNAPPLPSRSYTVAEVTVLARQAHRLMVNNGQQAFILSKDHLKRIPIGVYTAQLNDIEHFLNRFGRSLRDRAPRGDLGAVAKLADVNKASCPSQGPAYQPAIPHPSDPIEKYLAANGYLQHEVPGSTFGGEQGGWLPGARSTRALQSGATGSEHVFASLATRGALRYSARPVIVATSDQSLAVAVRSRSGTATWLANDRRLASIAVPAPRGPLLSGGIQQTMVAPGLLQFQGSPTGPKISVPMRAACGPTVIDNGPGLNGVHLDGTPGSTGGVAASEDGGVYQLTASGTKSACLETGSFILAMTPWDGCLATSGSFNSWFGGKSCVSISSNNSGKDGQVSFANTLTLTSDIVIFGTPLNLIRGDAFAGYASGKDVSQGKTITGLLHTLSGDGPCCAPMPGPSGVIPIGGPITLVITTTLNLTIDLTNLQPAGAALGTSCSDPAAVRVSSITGNATATAGASFEAAISAVVAKAGVGGQLTLIGGNLGGSATTDVSVANNLVTFTPTIAFDSKIGDGDLYAFVEVYLLVVSKRWEIELVKWSGDDSHTDLPHDPASTSAVTEITSGTCVFK